MNEKCYAVFVLPLKVKSLSLYLWLLEVKDLFRWR
jgi:hypothetical protein